MPPGYPRPDAFLDPDLVRQDLDQSLDRLGLPYVDVYYLHRDDPRVPAEELIQAANEHFKTGRTKSLGASNWSVARYQAANQFALKNGLQPFSILQNQWSLARPNWTDITSPGAVRFIQAEEINPLVDAAIVVAAYSAAANGYFSTDGATGKQFESPATREQLAVVSKLAHEKGVSPTQIALAYLLQHSVTTVPIIGTRNSAHLEDALAASRVELSPEDFAELDCAGR
jgi:hypothetical protein